MRCCAALCRQHADPVRPQSFVYGLIAYFSWGVANTMGVLRDGALYPGTDAAAVASADAQHAALDSLAAQQTALAAYAAAGMAVGVAELCNASIHVQSAA